MFTKFITFTNIFIINLLFVTTYGIELVCLFLSSSALIFTFSWCYNRSNTMKSPEVSMLAWTLPILPEITEGQLTLLMFRFLIPQKGDRNFLDRLPHKTVASLRQEPCLWMQSKTHNALEQRKGVSNFPQIFHIKHHVGLISLLSFDIIHNFGSQIVHIFRINLIIICCMCFL